MYTRNLQNKKAQTATEYIVIVAVVIVIALVLVEIMGGFPGIGSGTSKKVSDYKLASTGEIGIERYDFFDGFVLAKLKNNYFDILTISNITIAGVICNSSNTNISGTNSSAFYLTLNPGQTIIINCSDSRFNFTQNNGATPSMISTYTNPSTGASYTISSSGSGVSGNGTGGGSAPLENCSNSIDDDLDTFVDCADSNCTNTEYCVVKSLRSGLVSYFPLDTDVNDYFGTNHGTPTNILINSTNGVVGNGAYFNGASKIVLANEANFDDVFDGFHPFSYSVWISRPSCSSGALGLFTKGSDNDPTGGSWYQIDGSGTINLNMIMKQQNNDNSIIYRIGNIACVPNQFMHLVVVYNGSNTVSGINFYKNGILVSSLNNIFNNALTTGVRNNCAVVIGRESYGGCADQRYYYVGSMDEIAIYNRTLNDSEISFLYNFGNGRSLVQ